MYPFRPSNTVRLWSYLIPCRDYCQYSVFLNGYRGELESVGMGAINAMTAAQFLTHPYPCLRYKKRFSKVARPRLRRLAWLLSIVSIIWPGLVTIRRVDIRTAGQSRERPADSLPKIQLLIHIIKYYLPSALYKNRHKNPLFCPQN